MEWKAEDQGVMKLVRELKKNALAQAVLINLVVFGFVQLFCHPYFETNDDNFMAAILYGKYGEYSSRMVFINILIGRFLKVLLLIFPNVCWYTVFHYIVLFVSFTVICYLLLSESKSFGYGCFLCGVIIIFFGYEFYAKVQFTKTAAIAALAGGLLLFLALEAKQNKVKKYAVGFLLVMTGSMIRFSSFEMVFALLAGIGVYKCVPFLIEKKLSICIKYLCCFGSIIILCFGLHYYDKWEYTRSGEWKEYKEYNTLRAALLDYEFPDYELNKELYQSLGINQSDLDMFINWDFTDTEIFTKENMQQLADAKEDRSSKEGLWKEYFKTVPRGFLQYAFFGALLVMAALWAAGTRKGKFLLAYEVLALFAIEFYLFYRGRYLISRVDVSMFLAAVTVLAMLIARNDEWIAEQKTVCVLAGCILFAYLPQWNLGADPVFSKESGKEQQEVLELMNQDQENIYFISMLSSSSNWTLAYQLWDLVPKGIGSNYYETGGWEYMLPGGNAILSRYAIENPFQDMIDNKNAFYINNVNVDTSISYMQRHYSPDTRVFPVKVINDNTIYRVFTKEPYIDISKAIYDGAESNVDAVVLEDGQIQVKGTIYKNGANSFQQNVYIGFEEKSTGEWQFYYTTQSENDTLEDVYAGKYSRFERTFGGFDLERYDITVFLETGKELYAVECSK